MSAPPTILEYCPQRKTFKSAYIETAAGFNYVYEATFNTAGGFPMPLNWVSGYRFSIEDQNTLEEIAYSTTNIATMDNQAFILVNSQEFLQLSRGTYYYMFIIYDNANNPILMDRGVLRLI
jgi:hypothetical protein